MQSKTMISVKTELPTYGRLVLVLADGKLYRAVRVIDDVFHMDYPHNDSRFRFGLVDYWIYMPEDYNG